MSRSHGQRRVRAALSVPLLALVLIVVPTACADEDEVDPRGASNCTELVDRASIVAKQVLQSVSGKSIDDLRAEYPDDPHAPLTAPFVPFATRGEDLGCDQAELRRVACDAYQDLEADGPVAEEFLSTVLDTCR